VDKRLLGNFPQAFSHFGMVNTAYNLEGKTSVITAGGSPGTQIR
jgi:GH15 family glucan-1,4-alpha-glucosidase